MGRAKKFKSTRGLERRGKVKGIQAITGAPPPPLPGGGGGGLNKNPVLFSSAKDMYCTFELSRSYFDIEAFVTEKITLGSTVYIRILSVVI